MEVTITVKNNIPNLIEMIRGNVVEFVKPAGRFLEGKVAEQIGSGSTPPPLSPLTIARKGSSSTLVDTGQMLGQVETKEASDYVAVGIFGSRSGIATVHEFGSPSKNIPERSFLRKQLNENVEEMKDIISETIAEKIQGATIK